MKKNKGKKYLLFFKKKGLILESENKFFVGKKKEGDLRLLGKEGK